MVVTTKVEKEKIWGRQQITPRDNQCFDLKESHAKINELSSPVITVPPPLNDSVVNPPHMSLIFQQSYSSSQNTTPELQASSIPGGTSPYPSNTMSPPSTNNLSCDICRCMLDLSKLTSAQRQQNALMLLQNYHELGNINEPSSMCVSPTPIPNIE